MRTLHPPLPPELRSDPGPPASERTGLLPDRASLQRAAQPATLLIAAGAAASAFEPALMLRAGVGLCVLAALLRVRTLTIGWLDWAAALLVLLTVASLGWSRAPALTQLTALNSVAVVALFVSVRAVVTTLGQVVVVAAGFLAGCAAAAVLLFRQNRTARFVPELTDDRLAITGLNPNYLSYSLTTGVVLVVLLLRFRRLRLVAVASLLLIGWAMLQSGTRAALLATVLLGVWVVLGRFAPRVGLGVLVVAALAGAVATVTGLSDRLLVAVDASSSRATGDLAGRLVIWPLAREALAEHPWLGSGAGTFASQNTYGIGAHNAPLELGTGMGIVGVTLFGLILWGALLRSSAEVEPRLRNLLVGSLVLTWTPIYLSGHWELSPAAWIVLGLYSRLGPMLSHPKP